jgi:hemerythrin-like domain-containing protein
MGETNKPIKRSKELVPLSKEHHDGLLLGWKIKQGIRNGTDVTLISKYIQWFWENELEQHFRKEEEVLVPHLPADHELVQQMLREHEEIEALININAMIVDEDIFVQIADGLHDHIRFEERTLFPFAEGFIPAGEMQSIYEELLKTKEKGKWEDEEFWMRKNN